MKTSSPIPISPHQVRILAVETHRSPKSVVNAYRQCSKPIVREAVAEAARRLSLPEPPLAA